MPSLESLKQQPIFFFTSVPIAPSGQGSSMRVFTNLRAYTDLGFHIELIHVVDEHTQSKPVTLPEGDIHYQAVDRDPRALNALVRRMAMQLGCPRELLLNAMFPDRRLVVEEVRRCFSINPAALYHFEYDNFASAVTAFPGIRAIWSNHDLFSERVQLVWESRDERRSPDAKKAPRQTTLKRVRQVEDLLAKRSRLILNIAEHEHVEFHQRGYQNAVLLPMSWPDEEAVPRARAWKQDGKLRLLHLGSVNGLVGYESLKYLLGEVFPLLPQAALDRLELWVVGTVADSFYCNRIMEIAQAYPQVRFFGFVEDLRGIYGQVDVQVVGGVKASGLRTRIIESMVYGVPVLSTIEMARGLHALEPGKNVLLASSAQDYARQLTALVSAPPDLDHLAQAARETYDRFYSRSVAAQILSQSLQQYC